MMENNIWKYRKAIDDYYSSVINKIDINFENILLQNLTSNEINSIEVKRESVLKSIEIVKNWNIINLKNNIEKLNSNRNSHHLSSILYSGAYFVYEEFILKDNTQVLLFIKWHEYLNNEEISRNIKQEVTGEDSNFKSVYSKNWIEFIIRLYGKHVYENRKLFCVQFSNVLVQKTCILITAYSLSHLFNEDVNSYIIEKFNDLNHVDKVFYKNPKIEILCKNFLKGFKYLTELKLYDCYVKEIQSEIFSDLISLHSLEMSNINSENVDNKFLNGLGKLKILRCTFFHTANQTLFPNIIDSNYFINMAQLILLDIRFSNLSTLEDFCFINLKNLTTLNLEENKISIIKKHTFIGLTSLLCLCLNSNEISEIEDDAFCDLKELERLFMYNNKLIKLNKRIFNGLRKLTILDISCNLLEFIDDHIFENFSNFNIYK